MAILLPPMSLKRYPYIKDNTHIHYNNASGDQIPSVTTVLKIINKDSLIGWANHLGWKRKSVKTVLDETSYVGTMAHNYAESIMRGESIDFHELQGVRMDLVTDILNCVKSFRLWWMANSYRVKPILIETQLADDECGGTPDVVCELDDELCILDFKTSSAFYYTQFLQICKCADLYEHVTGRNSKVQNVAILRFNKDGSMAELLTMHDHIINQELSYESRELIEIYISTFNKALSLFYDVYDIEEDWRK